MGEDRTVSATKKRWILSIRTTADGRFRLQAAAEANGRSLSDEIESRLQQTFHADDSWGGHRNAAFVNLLGASIRAIEAETGKVWSEDRATWDRVKATILREIEERTPSKVTHRPQKPKPAIVIKARTDKGDE